MRFRAYGERHYVPLGDTTDGWDRARAERELRQLVADVDRGRWAPVRQVAVVAAVDPGFHAFASEWIEARRRELREATILGYSWQLSNHLLPFFHKHQLSQITVAEVDRYREHRVRDGVLSPESINKTITRLGQILAVAEERDLIARNPVRVNTRNRKLKASRPRPVYLDTAEPILALLDAATDLDAKPQARTAGRRALIATLVFAGLRIGEACSLRWSDIDLAVGQISVGASKTDAGVRDVRIVPVLREELTMHKMSVRSAEPDALVFPTSSGSRRDKDNARERVIRPVVKRAAELLAERGQEPLPDGISAHKLRHTFASLLVACGEDPAYVMAQMGHTDPAFTLRVYAHAMRRDDEARARLKALLEGADWAPLGTGERQRATNRRRPARPRNDKRPAGAGRSPDGHGWFRTSDLSRVKRALSR